jgi:hypothetical protein
MLCCVQGAGDLSLVFGKLPEIEAIKISRIMERIAFDSRDPNFLKKLEKINPAKKTFKNPIPIIQKISMLKSGNEKIRELIDCLDDDYYDLEEIRKNIEPFLFFSEYYHEDKVKFFLEQAADYTNNEELLLGYCCFFDLSNSLVKIKIAKELKGSKAYIEKSKDKFCIANLNFSAKGQDLNIAEGFCKNYNSILKRNHLKGFMILREE